MCKVLDTSMAIGYALSKDSRVTGETLRQRRKSLMDKGYLLDVSQRTVSKVVEAFSEMMEFKNDGESFIVSRKAKKGRRPARMFDENHLRMCFKSEADFPTDEAYDDVARLLKGR